jgi:hypothetical protein
MRAVVSTREPSASDGRRTVVRLLTATVLVGGVLAACSPSHHAASSPARSDASTTTSVAGRAVAKVTTFRAGAMKVEPSPDSVAAVPASRALTLAGGLQSGDDPEVLLGRLTVSDYARGTVPIINHRLVWLVVYRHHLMANHGCGAAGNRGLCRATFGIRAVPVDADTGKLLGDWQWAGFA